MKKLNIAFVNMPSIPLSDIEKAIHNESLRFQIFSAPMGIMHISSYLKKHGDPGQIGLIDYVGNFQKIDGCSDVDSFIVSIAEQSITFRPDVIAFSLLFSASYNFFEHTLGILSKMWPEAVSVVGGVHATNSTKELLELNDVDYVVRGEAEVSFTELIRQLSCSQDVNVKGVYSKENVTTAEELMTSDLIVDLDTLPFADRNILDMQSYANADCTRARRMGANLPVGTIITTRGCPYHCTFCSAHTVHGRKVRYRSVENIIEEIKLLHENYGISILVPEDDLFTVDRDRILTLLRKIKELGFPEFEIQTPSGLSVKHLDEEIITELIACGMHIFSLAIESGSEYVQKHVIKKNCDLDKARKLVDIIKSKGAIVRCFFIVGFPGETKAQMQETVDYARSLKLDWGVFMIAAPLIGSEMFAQFVEMGCIRNDVRVWSNTVFDSRQFDTPQIGADELNDFLYRANLDCNFINNYNKIEGNFEKAITIYEEILSRYPFHIIACYCIWECYRMLGQKQNMSQVQERIRKLIETDKRAAEMFSKYGDMMGTFRSTVIV